MMVPNVLHRTVNGESENSCQNSANFICSVRLEGTHANTQIFILRVELYMYLNRNLLQKTVILFSYLFNWVWLATETHFSSFFFSLNFSA